MVKVPGSCGELAQGFYEGQSILITCPVNWYSTVVADIAEVAPEEKTKNCKSYKAVDILLEKYGKTASVVLRIQSDLPRGKGMASSSADIAAACMATAKIFGQELTLEEIKDIALSVEPTDGVFMPGIFAFDHITGNCCQFLGSPPPIRLAIFDFGGEVDTVAFNKRADLATFKHEQQLDFSEAYALIKEGLETANPVLIGKGATISALANQKILPKPHLEKMILEAIKYGALGVNVAHSGTVAGVLFDKANLAEYSDCVQAVLAACPGIVYIGAADLIAGGIFDGSQENNNGKI